jgi:tRNA threonylcarbamoyladenosine biosynthesis protein TsaB
VLGVDTATSAGSVALARPGLLIAETALPEKARHARELLDRIDTLLRGAGLEPRDLRGLGVAAGPGSFTGVRVGLATAKGLAYSLAVGLAGLSTLEALARAATRQLAEAPGAVCPAIEAGRGEVYASLFLVKDGVPFRSEPDRSWRPEALARHLPEGTVLVGDGARRVEEAAGGPGRLRVSIDPCPRLAGAIALWACEALRGRSGYRPGEVAPNYVRPLDAEAARRPR